MRNIIRRVLPVLVVAAVVGAIYAAAPPRRGEERASVFEGKVVPLADLIAKSGTKLDADAAPFWLALVCDDGKVYPLVKDDGGRMFFKDKRLLNRPMRLTGRLIPGSNLLQVTNVHSYRDGKLHDVYYWCDICSIRGYELHNCDCCGDLMVLREVPVK
jgi:hypothetical protein